MKTEDKDTPLDRCIPPTDLICVSCTSAPERTCFWPPAMTVADNAGPTFSTYWRAAEPLARAPKSVSPARTISALHAWITALERASRLDADDATTESNLCFRVAVDGLEVAVKHGDAGSRATGEDILRAGDVGVDVPATFKNGFHGAFGNDGIGNDAGISSNDAAGNVDDCSGCGAGNPLDVAFRNDAFMVAAPASMSWTQAMRALASVAPEWTISEPPKDTATPELRAPLER